MRSCAHDGPTTSCSHSASAHVHCAPDTCWALGVMLGREGEPDGRKHFVHRLLFSVRSTKVMLHVEAARLARIPDGVVQSHSHTRRTCSMDKTRIFVVAKHQGSGAIVTALRKL